MLERIMGMSTGVYILWGLGVLGVLLKFFANAYIRGMVRASADLGDTKRKKLRNMCKKYENKKSFGLCGGDEEAYAESFVRGLRFLTRPMEFWNRSGTVLSLVVCGTMAGAYLYYDPSWRGSPDMQFFLANSILVCACLLVLDHILVINNKVEILKANIRGYLERIPKPREEPRARVEPFAIKKVAARTGKEDEAPKEPAEPSGEGTDDGKAASDPVPDKESAASEETLNRFLEQFFFWMRNYRVGNETEHQSRFTGKWKGVVCLAGLLICLAVGGFSSVTYGASAGEADGSESEQVDTSGNPTSDVEDGLTGTTEGYAEQEDGARPIQSMFDKCRKVFCRYQTYPIENHLKEREAYQSLDNTKLSWWFRRDMNHGPSGCDDTIDIAEYDGYYLDSDASSQNEKVLYLTFDCGYENGYTGQMLDILKKEDVPACFFVTQTYIRDNVDLVKRMKEEGHQVGNHTIYHICMPDKSYEEIVQEVNGCADYMKEATGYAMDPYLRPPCGEYSARTLAITQDLGFKTIFWSMAYMDFDVNNQPGVDFVIDHFNKYHHSGAIILMHNVSSSNAGALEKVIANLKAEGYRFASLNELQ